MNFKQQLYYWTHMLDEAMEDKCLLTEDKEGKNINRAEKWIKDNHPEIIGQTLADGKAINNARDVIEVIRRDIPNARLPYILDVSGKTIPVIRKNGETIYKGESRWMLGIVRIYFELLNDPNSAQKNISLLNQLVWVLDKNHKDEYQDQNLNDMSFDDLMKYKPELDEYLKRDRDALNNMSFDKKSDYDIIAINSFEQAETYGKYTSWCVTKEEMAFDHYTHEGLGRFYFCLTPGFQNVQKTKGEGCPLDEYGKSMIAISVNDDGSLNTCTCRWNHDNGADDYMMDTKKISEFFGVNFYKTFVPYSADEVILKYDDIVDGYDEFSVKNNTRRCRDPETGEIFYVKVVDNKIVKYVQAGAYVKDSNGRIYNFDCQEVKQSQYSGNPDDYEVGDIVLVKYEGKDIPWIVLDKKDGNLVIQSGYALEKREFDETKSNIWRDSSLRKQLNSNEFMSRFDAEFLKHVKSARISTGSSDGQIVTDDKFWLLSQENIGYNDSALIKSDDSQFKFFQNNTTLNRRRTLDEDELCTWWLRSPCSDYPRMVGYVSSDNHVSFSSTYYDDGVLPACIIS